MDETELSMDDESNNNSGGEEVIRPGDYVKIIRGNFSGYFAIVDPEQTDGEEISITYFAEKQGTHGKYWVLNEIGGDARFSTDLSKVEPKEVGR